MTSDDQVELRYKQKVKDFCGGIDPFGLKGEKSPLPRNVGYFDVYNYCVLKDSAYTHDSFKAYKTLEAYQFFENGWVQSIICKKIASGWIMLAKVKHSYRLKIAALPCWVSVDLNGIVLTGHCKCMAGTGEVCSHVGAIFFMLEAWGRKSQEIDSSESISCTDVLSKWLVPRMKSVEMASVDNICWDSTPNSKSNEDVSVLNDTIALQVGASSAGDVSIISQDGTDTLGNAQVEIDNFLHKIKGSGVACPLMAMRNPFSTSFVPKNPDEMIFDLTTNSAEGDINIINLYLTSLYEPAYKSFPLEELQAIASDFELKYTQDEIYLIERETRSQSDCTLWYRFRAGRVTASVFKSVCRTSIATPAMCTIGKICFPEKHILKTKATEYGKRNEPKARDAFFAAMSAVHNNYEMKTTGLIINNKYPFFGVSPDALVSCDCCGSGVLEIKCPYQMRFGESKTYLDKKKGPLVLVDTGSEWKYKLKPDHEYYYQVQMQMFLAEVEYCDFVVWNPKSFIPIRVYKDESFWNDNYNKASDFFKKVLVPELLTCFYTRKQKQPK